MSDIYIVWACDAYEAPIDLAAFRDKESADKFLEAVKKYNKTSPKCPDASAGDKKWDKYYGKIDNWKAGHPAGEAGSQTEHAASYGVAEMDFTD